MQNQKLKIIFIHGFGVSKFSRGIFTDIEKYSPPNLGGEQAEFIYTDLNLVENIDGKENITIKTPQEQAKIIEEVVENLKQKEIEEQKINSNLKYKYIFICHSLGCVIATLLNKNKIPNNSKFIFLAPPTANDLEKTFDRYRINPINILDLNGISKLHRRDGSITFIPKEFWQARENLDYVESYRRLAKYLEQTTPALLKQSHPFVNEGESENRTENKNKISIIIAKQDEVIENNEATINDLQTFAQVIEINGNHNFDNERENLAEKIKEIILEN